jgi:type IV fimbrial biogenesis protein FimT
MTNSAAAFPARGDPDFPPGCPAIGHADHSHRQLRRRTRGFTLVEAAVVLAITSILAVAAAPSFTRFITAQRIKTSAFDLFSDLVYARSTAIKTSSPVTVAPAAGGWSGGWRITRVDSTGTTVTLRTHALAGGDVAITGSVDQFAYERNGRPLAGTAAVKFTLDDAGGLAAIDARCIQIGNSGRPSSLLGLCS